jgi:EAL and modified HD-GYP domain-containing signal transduction protein
LRVSAKEPVVNDDILSQVALGYGAFIERNCAVTATRLTVFALQPDARLDAAQLLEALAPVWPADGPRLVLGVNSESLLQQLLQAAPPAHMTIEVPAFMACDEANTRTLVALHAHGNSLLLKGAPLKTLCAEVRSCFSHSLLDLADGPPAHSGLPHIFSGIRTPEHMEDAFERGAAAVLGWPIGDEVTRSAPAGAQALGAPIDLQAVVELMRQVDQAEPVDKIERTLKRDPSLSFKILRYINSPAFGLSVVVSSFSHAVMLLGYQRLKRWLALMLATASTQTRLRPTMFASVRRGLLMEELTRDSSDAEMRNELFICGVFSLLDRLFDQPLPQLLRTIPVPQGVYDTLAEGRGPYVPYFDLARAIEAASPGDIRDCADALMMDMRQINRALLRALTTASELD